MVRERLPKQRLPRGKKRGQGTDGLHCRPSRSAPRNVLTDKQKETPTKFDDCYAELTEINEREIFVYAFRLGMLIAIEVFTELERQ